MTPHTDRPQSAGAFYSMPEQNKSGTSMPYARNWERVQLSPAHDEQPSFSASSSSLPGALGLPAVDIRNSTPSFDQTHASPSSSSPSWTRKLANGSSAGPYNASLSSYESSSSPPVRTPTDGGPVHVVGKRPGTAGDAASGGVGERIDGAGGGNAGNMRNFLVPIGATGARQKLSILSASQRPRTAQASTAVPAFGKGSLQSRSGARTDSGYSGSAASDAGSEGWLAMQRSESDLDGMQRRRPSQQLPSEAREEYDDDLQFGRRLTLTDRNARSAVGSANPSTSALPSSQRPYRTASGASSFDGSVTGGGFSPQLTSALAGQSSLNGTTSRSNNSHAGPGFYRHRQQSSQTSLPPTIGAHDAILPRMGNNPGEAQHAPRSMSSPYDSTSGADAAKHPISVRDQVGVGRSSSGSALPDGVAMRPRSSSSTAKDMAVTFKSGFRSMFGRSGKSSRPSTASIASSSTISSPRPFGASTPDTFTSSSVSPSPSLSMMSPQKQAEQRGHEGAVNPVSWQQHNRTTSSSSSLRRTKGDQVYPTTPLKQRAGEPTYSNDLQRSTSNSSWLSSPLSGSTYSSVRPSEDSIRDNLPDQSPEVARSRIAGRRPSRDHMVQGIGIPLGAARPMTAPSTRSVDSIRSAEQAQDTQSGDERSKTPVPHGPTVINGSQTRPRRPSDASDWSQRTASNFNSGPTLRSTDSSSSIPVDRSGRRASGTSEASTQSSRDTVQSAGKRIDGSAASMTSASTGDSIYSAPNSSRALLPSDPDKPTVPLTSPLLAPVLGQQGLHSLISPLTAHQRTEKSLKIASPVTSGDETPTSSPPLTAATSPPAKPALPVKSRNRTSTRTASDDIPVQLTAALSEMEAKSPGKDATTPSIQQPPSTQPKEQHVDPRMVVPPDALKRTRRGVPVRGTNKEENSARRDETLAESKEKHWLGSGDSFQSPLTSFKVPVSPLMRDTDTLALTGTDNPGVSGPIDSQGTEGQIISFNSGDYEPFGDDDDGSVDTVNLLPASAWAEIEAALLRFKAIPQQSANDKGALLRTVLLPFLALEAETPETQVSGSGAFQSDKARRSLFFEWIRQLLLELQTIQTSADRGAILESIACIVESRNFSAPVVEKDAGDQQTFFNVLGHIMSYAIGELNKKGVYQNTLIFSGRLLAVAFFRIEGVASKLLRALPVNRFALERVATEARWQEIQPSDWEAFKRHFPAWLHDFCFEDARSYLKMLDSQPGQSEDDDRFLVRQESVEVEMTGNWLRRWQSDDSELFFSFCRSYHRQLAGIFLCKKPLGFAIDFDLFFGGPGFAHLATCIHQKCLSLVHRDILSVTTLSSQKSFNPGETANVLSGSTAGKPRHLEAANRRCTAIVVDIVRMAPASSRSGLFAQMLGIHVKCLVKRTSLYDVQGVFCLLDWLDGVLSHMENAEMVVGDFIDVDFLLHSIWLLLKDADHALALMRTIAFCYSNFAILTGTRRHRERFFEEILLHPAIFQKLFLSWSFTIRAYFLHLLVFRLARINDFSNPDDDPKGKTSVRVVKLFSKRLDEIRKRHDELSPQPSSTDSQSDGHDDDDDDFARFKRRPQSFVSTIRHTPSVHKADASPGMTKAERVLGIGMPDPVLSSKGESKAQSRAAKWLRALGGKGTGKSNKAGMLSSPSSSSGKLSNDVPKIFNEPRARLPRLDELDMFSDEDEEEDEAVRGSDDENATPRGEDGFEFNFEPQVGYSSAATLSPDAVAPSAASVLPDGPATAPAGEHISPDMSFDLQTPMSSFSAAGGGLPDSNGADPSHHRISRAFSRRQSMLPGPALSLVNGGSESELDTEAGDDASATGSGGEGTVRSRGTATTAVMDKDAAPPYDRNLHIYAVQSLREYEQTVQEHDDFFSSQQDSTTPQVPRLPIQWPAMWSE